MALVIGISAMKGTAPWLLLVVISKIAMFKRYITQVCDKHYIIPNNIEIILFYIYTCQCQDIDHGM